MKVKKIILIVMALIVKYSSGQNLVANFSFEDTVACPFANAQIDFSTSWNSFRISPDYFNSCNSNLVGVPQNQAGYQYPNSGNAYAGIFTFARFGTNAREIIGGQLISNLTIGQRYLVSFFVCLAINNTVHTNIASNKLGFTFFTNSFSSSNPVPINNTAHIYSDSIITDSVLWTKIEGSFIADSAYQYFGIGNFFDDAQTSTINFDSTGAFAYYYIDDVSVTMDSLFDKIDQIPKSKQHCKIHYDSRQLKVSGNNMEYISIYNISGFLIFENSITPTSTEFIIPIESIPTGIYLISVYADKKYYFKISVDH